MSEHSRANALDMSGFTFAGTGKGVAVGGGNWGEGILAALGVSRDGSFLEAIRKGACAHFTTVLGPGSIPITATTSTWTCCAARATTASASDAHGGVLREDRQVLLRIGHDKRIRHDTSSFPATPHAPQPPHRLVARAGAREHADPA